MQYKNKVFFALFIVFGSLITPPMVLVNVGVGISAIRIISLVKWLTAAFVLSWLVKPNKKENKCAIITSIIASLINFSTEKIGIFLGLWAYQGKFLLSGVPVDVPIHFFLFSFVFCLGYILFSSTNYSRIIKIIYLLGWPILLGIEGYFANIWAPKSGFVVIAKNVGPHSLIYLLFFVVFGFFVTGMFVFIYRLISRSLK